MSPPNRSTHLIETTPNISQLLPELLEECFIHIRDFYFYTRSPYSWLHIMQVCKYWHDIALACPRLWCFINLPICPLDIIQLFTKRSGSVPLTVLSTPYYQDLVRDYNYVDEEEKLVTVLDQAHRLQNLNIYIHESSITKLNSQYPDKLNMPVLRVIIIGSPPYSPNHTPLPFHFDSPMLTSLQLMHFDYYHIATHFNPRLRSLIIGAFNYPSVDQLLDHLQGMPSLEVLELWGLWSLVPMLNDKRKLRLEQLKSLAIKGGTDMIELITRIVTPPQGITLSLSMQTGSITLEKEKISTILDMVPDLSRCGVKSIQYPNNRRIVRSVHIELYPERCHLWGWSSVLAHITNPPYEFSNGQRRLDDVVYHLSLMDRDPESQVDIISMMSHNLDFSQVRTLILKMGPQEWDRSHVAVKAILDDLNNTVETLIAYLWDLESLALFLSTGDCKNVTSPFNDDDTSPSHHTIPFPNLRILSVHGATHTIPTVEPKLPLTNALKYRAKHGYRIEYLHMAGSHTTDAHKDLMEADKVVGVI